MSRWFRHSFSDDDAETVTRVLIGYRYGVAYDALGAKDRKKERPKAESTAELILSRLSPVQEGEK